MMRVGVLALLTVGGIGCWSESGHGSAADGGSDSDSDTGADTDPECAWEEVFPLGGDPVGAPYARLLWREDGSLAAVSRHGEVVLGGGTEFDLVLQAVPEFVALDAAEDQGGDLVLVGFPGPGWETAGFPVPDGYTGPPKAIRFDGATFEEIALGDIECNAVSGIWTDGAGQALLLCVNGNLLERSGSGWTSLAGDLPYELVDLVEPSPNPVQFRGLWGDWPNSLLVFGVDPPNLGHDATAGFIYHYNGIIWHHFGGVNGMIPHISPVSVWGSSWSDVYTLACDVSEAYRSDLVINHFTNYQWTTEAVLLDSMSNGVFYGAYRTRPLLVGDDAYLATMHGVYHGSADGWSLVEPSPPGEPRHIVRGDDVYLYVAVDDGRIFRGACLQ